MDFITCYQIMTKNYGKYFIRFNTYFVLTFKHLYFSSISDGVYDKLTRGGF